MDRPVPRVMGSGVCNCSSWVGWRCRVVGRAQSSRLQEPPGRRPDPQMMQTVTAMQLAAQGVGTCDSCVTPQ